MIIDTHCHFPYINPNINNWEELYKNKYSKHLISYLARYYSFKARSKYSNNIASFRNNILEGTLENINSSKLDYATIFAVDGVYDEYGEIDNRESVLFAPNSKVLDVSRVNNKVLPGASLSLNRKDIYEELEYIISNNFVLIKIHPSMQRVDIGNLKYKNLYKRIASAGIPLLVHVGFESSIPGYNGVKEYNKVQNLRLPLEMGCTVIAAHGGGTPMNFFGSEEKAFIEVRILLDKYPNLYLDNSATYSFHRPNRAKTMLKHKQYSCRYLYGSDYPNVTAGMLANLVRVNGRNMFDLDIEKKMRLGFAQDTFSKIINLSPNIRNWIGV